MEDARVYTCGPANAVRSRLFNKKEDVMFLKIDGTTVSGKGEICNSDGKNGYTGDFSYEILDIADVKEEEYNMVPALSFTAQERGIYGNKKIKIFLPQLKQANEVRNLLNQLKQQVGDGASPAATNPVPVPVSAPKAREERPSAQPKPIENPAPAQPTPMEQPKAVERPADQPKPVENPAPGKPAPIAPEPVVAPVEEEKPAKQEISEEEFQKRMDKLAVLKDCGLLGEKEYVSKRLELVSEFCDLKDFNDKIQKLIALKDCGLLSDKEFDANRIDVIKECCDLDVNDINEYRRNVQKLSVLQIGEVITPDEYDRSKASLVSDVEFKLEDTKEIFVRKLRRLPVLKECKLIDDASYEQKVSKMLDEVRVSKNDSRDVLVNKLKKWPILAQEKYILAAQLSAMQSDLISSSLDVTWKTPDELKAIINRMSALNEGECLSDAEYATRRSKLLAEIDAVEDYTTRVSMYIMLPQVGFITDSEYEVIKQKCIDDILKSSHSVEDFKVRANNLKELQKVGMLTEAESNLYKSKLMSEL